MARITVGIPAYSTRFLVQAIASVLEQTFTDYELLISDDSPDGSVGEVVRRFHDPRIRLIPGPREGLAANAAHIWKNASADFLKFLCDDDILFPTALTTLSDLLKRDERYTFAFGRQSIIDTYGRVLRKPLGFLGDNWVWFDAPALAKNLVEGANNGLAGLSNMLIRRSAFPDTTCLTTYAGLPIRSQVDAAFIMNAAARGPSVASCSYLTGYREHPDQTSAHVEAPAYSASLFEWEIFLRGAVQLGMVSPESALLGLPSLQRLYGVKGAALGEIALLQRGLPALSDQLAAGARDVVTDKFREELAIAEVLIEGRRSNGASPSVVSLGEGDDPSTRFHGKIEYISRDRARGWAWAPEAGDQAVQVLAMIDDRVVGHAIADQERRDLANWNLGTRQYGFDMAFYQPLLTDKTPRFRLFTQSEDWLPGPVKLAPLDAARIKVGDEDGAEVVLREHAKFTQAGPQYETFDWTARTERPRLISGPAPLISAFYLPQFHAIPENDRFWGTGFTEWRQLARAAPRFPGHYQPRIPRDLGFYNLLDADIIGRQADMAKAAGVGAFAYYYYWFDKQRVLHRPLEVLLNSNIEMPFYIIWANENWTRQWDGSQHEVLLQQTYKPDHEDALLADLARHMIDPRYVRLNGRPLFVIYNPDAIPDIRTTVARWRETWDAKFGLQPLIFMAQTFNRTDPRPYGLDGALEFPPHKLGQHAQPRDVIDAFSRDFRGQVIPYDDFVKASVSELDPNYPLIKTAAPSWDNEARRPNRSVILDGSSPKKYQAWLETLLEKAIENPVYGAPMVAINAWNEWAEGAYLEPDVYYGASYLNATGRALNAAIRKKNVALSEIVTPSRRLERSGKPRVFLHIGLHKTGTTSIQGALSRTRADLAERGVLYPQAGLPKWANLGQHLLPWSVAEQQDHLPLVHGHKAQFQPGETDALWNRLHAEIAGATAGTVILSSEEFDTLSRTEIDEVGRRLAPYDVTPVLFLRRSSRLLESNYRTSVIYSQYGGDIEQFRHDHRTRLDVYDMLGDWRSIAKDGEAIVLNYDQRETQRDVVAAFMAAVGLDDLAVRSDSQPRLNKSTPAYLCEAVLLLRRSNVREEAISQWLLEVGRLPALSETSQTYTCMTPALEAELDALYAGEIARLLADPRTAAMIQGTVSTSFPPSRAVTVDQPSSAILALGHEVRRGKRLSER